MTYEGDWWCAGSRACDGGVGCSDSGVGSDCNGGSSWGKGDNVGNESGTGESCGGEQEGGEKIVSSTSLSMSLSRSSLHSRLATFWVRLAGGDSWVGDADIGGRDGEGCSGTLKGGDGGDCNGTGCDRTAVFVGWGQGSQSVQSDHPHPMGGGQHREWYFLLLGHASLCLLSLVCLFSLLAWRFPY